ncbi:MAG: hypothetical protein AB9866_18870 [Syntrophobacteraceae bacterium]
MKKEEFEKEQLPTGTVIFRHIPSGLYRDKLLRDCKLGRITQEQMRSEAK